MQTVKADQPIMHVTHNGVIFVCERADLKAPLFALTERLHFEADTLEFGAWHAQMIWPELNGFQGYDTVTLITHKCKCPIETYEKSGDTLEQRAHNIAGYAQ